MILRKGDMFSHPCDVLLFTANSVTRRDGALVMGAGAARLVSRLFPESSEALGSLILSLSDARYGLVWYPREYIPYVLGAFQSKQSYTDASELDLISFSTGMLTAMAQTDWRSLRISLNFPGIGLGKLRRSDVLPIIQSLPNNVTIWEL